MACRNLEAAKVAAEQMIAEGALADRPSTAARKSDPSLRMTEIEVCGGGFRGDESWAEGADNVHPFA
jgi:hypothetical protein